MKMKLSRTRRHLAKKGLPAITCIAILFCCSFSTAAEPVSAQADILTAIPLSSAPLNIQQTLSKGSDFNAIRILPDDNLYSITAENEDGKGKIELYSTPVKFTDDDGNVSFIDTGMTQNGMMRSLFDGYSYKNTANSFTAEFSTNAEKGFSLNKQFTFGVYQADTEAAKGYVDTDELGNGRMVYEDFYGSGTTLAHTNINTGVKNEIVLTEPAEQNVFSFLYTSSTHDLVLAEDNAAVFLVDQADEENIDYIFQPIYVYDSYKAESLEAPGSFKHFTEDSTYQLTPINDTQTRVDIIVPEEFLSSPEVVYPVQITAASSEGVLETPNSAAIVDDTYVKESSPSSNYYLLDYMSFGYNSGRIHGYVRFPQMVTLPAGTSIDRAEFILRFRSGQTTADPSGGACSRVTTFREGKDITWNTRPSSGADRVTANHIWEEGEIRYYKFPVTNIVSKWLNGTAANNGFQFGYNNEYYNDYNSVVSSDGEAYRAPKLLVYYKTVGSGPAYGITSGQTYYLRNANSGYYLDVPNSSSADGTDLKQYCLNGGTNQRFRIVYNSSTRDYSLYPVHAPNSAMEITNGSTANDAVVQIWTKPSSGLLNSQRFSIVRNSNGSYRLLSYSSNYTKAVVVKSALTNEGASIIQYSDNGSTNGFWYIEPANKTIKTNTNSSANSSYNREWAANYAETYGPNPNTKYKYFGEDGGDCTNFVSQCLYAGTLPMLPTNGVWGVTDKSAVENWFYIAGVAGLDWYSVSFTSATRFNQHWGQSNMRAFQTIEYINGDEALKDIDFLTWYLKKGDVIQFKLSDGTFTHSMIIYDDNEICDGNHRGQSGTCSGKDKKELLYAQHSTNSAGNYNNGHVRALLENNDNRIVFTKIKRDV